MILKYEQTNKIIIQNVQKQTIQRSNTKFKFKLPVTVIPIACFGVLPVTIKRANLSSEPKSEIKITKTHSLLILKN